MKGNKFKSLVFLLNFLLPRESQHHSLYFKTFIKKDILPQRSPKSHPHDVFHSYSHLIVRCALFTGTDFCYQRQTPSSDCDRCLCQSPRAGAQPYHLISGVSSLRLSLSSLLHLYWRVLYTWCHDGSELLHSSSFHSCRL